MSIVIGIKALMKGYKVLFGSVNKSFEDWGDIFADNILASAILDRVVHYSPIIKINGASYRAKDVKKVSMKER